MLEIFTLSMTVLNKLRKVSKLLVTKVVPQTNGNCDGFIVHIRTLTKAGMHWVHNVHIH